MKTHSIVNLFRYPNLEYQARLCSTFIGQVPSLLNGVVKTTKISKALQATQDGPSHGAVTLSSQFITVSTDADSRTNTKTKVLFLAKVPKKNRGRRWRSKKNWMGSTNFLGWSQIYIYIFWGGH